MRYNTNFSRFIETIGFNQYPDYYCKYNQLAVGQEFIIPSYQNQTEIFKTKTGEDFCLSRKFIDLKCNIFVKTQEGFTRSHNVGRNVGLMLNSFSYTSTTNNYYKKFNKKEIDENLLLFPIKYAYNMNRTDIHSIRIGDVIVANSFWDDIDKNYSEYYNDCPDQINPHFICGEVVEIHKSKLTQTCTYKVQTSKTEKKFFDVKVTLSDIFNFNSANYTSVYRLDKTIRRGHVKVKLFSNMNYCME